MRGHRHGLNENTETAYSVGIWVDFFAQRQAKRRLVDYIEIIGLFVEL